MKEILKDYVSALPFESKQEAIHLREEKMKQKSQNPEALENFIPKPLVGIVC